jgi:hypothetical protein
LAARSLAIRAVHLLSACTNFARLVLNFAHDFLNRALNLVLDAGLAFVVGSWSAFLGDAGSRARFGGVGLGLLRGGTLARRLGGDGGYNSGLRVAGCAAGRGHYRCRTEV